MIDFEIQRCSRRCAATDREFAPGEVFHSVLVADGAEVVRRDYCAAAWQGPPENAIGHWKSRMPEANAKKAHWAPNDVILHFFQQLEGVADQQDLRYVLALLLVRRRIVRLEEPAEESVAEGAGKPESPLPEQLLLLNPRDDVQYRVSVVQPAPERIRQIQEELARLLFADAA